MRPGGSFKLSKDKGAALRLVKTFNGVWSTTSRVKVVCYHILITSTNNSSLPTQHAAVWSLLVESSVPSEV